MLMGAWLKTLGDAADPPVPKLAPGCVGGWGGGLRSELGVD